MNFGNIELKMKSGFLRSDVLGNYKPMLFKFSGMTLQVLTKHIQQAFLN